MERHPSGPENSDGLGPPIRFAYHNFDNLQALIRFADTKAGALTGFIFLLFGLGSEFLGKGFDKIQLALCLSFPVALSALFCLAWATFVFTSSIATFLLLVRGVLPRRAVHYPEARKAKDLMYWEHVLLHDRNAGYHEALHEMTEETELRNVSDQIYELAHITRDKMRNLKRARNWLFVATGSWGIGVLVTIFLVRGI